MHLLLDTVFVRTPSVLLDIGVTSGMPLKQITKLCKIAQKTGLNHAWIGEDLAASHDVFTVSSLVLLKFSAINVGIGITSPLVRNITTIARASASLAEIGGDQRFRLGLGIGGLHDLRTMGISVRYPTNLMRNSVALLQRTWKNETISFKNENFAIEGYRARYDTSYRIRVFFGVRGQRLLRLAGEIADGVILSGPKTYLKKAISLVKDSLKRNAHSSRDFKFVVWVPTILAESPKDLNLVRQIVAFVLVDTPRQVLEMAGLDYEQVERIKEVYQRQGMKKASELVTEGLTDEAAIHGNPKKILEAFGTIEKLGVHEVVFGPPYGVDPEKAVMKVSEEWKRFS